MNLVILLMILMSVSVFAKEGGNGGDVIVCRDQTNGEITSVELLDYYEARQMRKFQTIEYPNLSDDEFIDMIGNKINSMEDLIFLFDADEGKELLQSIRQYMAEGHSSTPGILFTEEILTDINDSEQLFIPRGCQVEQIAIWQFQDFPDDPKFIIQADLLKRLSDRDIRGLVLHEIIYKSFYMRSQQDVKPLKDSYACRYLHEKIMSQPVEEFTFKNYVDFMKGLYARQGTGGHIYKNFHKFDIRNIFFYKNGFLAKVKGTDVTIALNEEGEIDRELTRRYGRVRVTPYFNLYLQGYNPGKLKVGDNEIDFVGDFRTDMTVKFGMQEMSVLLNPFSSQGPQGMFGFSYTGTDLQKHYITIDLSPSPTPVVGTKKLMIDMDEQFQFSIKEVVE